MKHLIVSFLLLFIGLNIPARAQIDLQSEVYVQQMYENKEINKIYEETIGLPDRPLSDAFFNLYQILNSERSNMGNIAYGLQVGDRNIMDIGQIGSSHVALSWQQGDNNIHSISQIGAETTASGIQIGDSNKILQTLNGVTTGMVIQLGYGNLAEQELSGNNNGIFLIQQEGNNNSLYQNETGISVPYQIRQRGNDMELIITNSIIQ